jgi:2-polyprenyl-3-methyl-5-hydroxy-6-metoxy-1,4-benzoquinol methylase
MTVAASAFVPKELQLASDAVTDQALQHRVLESLASARNYIAWLCSLARPYLGDDPIEVGAGAGDYAATWLADGFERLTLTEADPQLLAALRSRFAGDERVTLRDLDVTKAPVGDHSALVAFNVLEHIEDDVAALRGAKALVRPGGAIVLFVPAFEFAMSGSTERSATTAATRSSRSVRRSLEPGSPSSNSSTSTPRASSHGSSE